MSKHKFESGAAGNGNPASFWVGYHPHKIALYIYEKTGIVPTATLATAVAKACGWKEGE